MGRDAAIWQDLQSIYDTDGTVHGLISGTVEGGLVVDLGLPAFLPLELAHVGPVENAEDLVGEWTEFHVLHLDRPEGRVILNRRSVLEEHRWEERRRVLENLEAGQEVEGRVSELVDFGAFVDLGGLDALVHVSELADRPVYRPEEVVGRGQLVRARVLEVDLIRERVSLSLRRASVDR